MSNYEAGLTPTQKAAITESAVATALMIASDGRLSVFTPVADDHGVDLIVYDKATGAMLPLQVKSWTAGPGAKNIIQFDVQKSTFIETRDQALILVLFDRASASIAMSWMMPTSEVTASSVSGKEKYALTPSVSPNTRDRYVKFRHSDVDSLIAAVVAMLESQDRT